MSGGRRLPVLLGLALLACYLVRLPGGWVGGVNYTRGRQLAGWGDYRQALPYLERADVGFNRAATLWLTGQVRLGLWQQGMDEGRPTDELRPLLEQAHREYTEAITLSPASGWYWASLGDLHHQRERVRRWERGESLSRVTLGPWASVGRSGRLAVGMTRKAIEREPFVYTFHDQLAFILLDYGIENEALAAVRRSAEVLPVYGFHAYSSLTPEPPGLVDAFEEGAESALGRTPYLRRVIHLIALTQLARRQGDLEKAERWAREALDGPGDRRNRAQIHFELGRVLMDQGRLDEADAQLEAAASLPLFAPVALKTRARVAEERDRLQDALSYLAEARRLEPRDLAATLEFARIAERAGDPERADEALRWARLVHPFDPRAIRLELDVRLGRGDTAGAARALAELRRVSGESEEVRRYEARLASGGGGE